MLYNILECPKETHPTFRHDHIIVYVDIIVNDSLGAGGGILNTCDFYGIQASTLPAKIC